jgi:hypothetical protein
MSSSTRKFLSGAGSILSVSETSPLYVDVPHQFRDAFSRLRVSEPLTLFDSKHLHDKLPLLYDEEITNNSTNATSVHSATDARVRMHVEAGDTIKRQSYSRMNYQPGKSQLAMFTLLLDANGGTTDVTRRVGLYDGTDGVYLLQIGTAVAFAIEKNGSRTTISQSSWNLDKLDGTGPSGVTLDTTKVQILAIDYEWLGVGSVRFGFVYNDQIVYAHREDSGNVKTSVYMSTPNLPIHYSISSAVTTGAIAEMDHICSTVISEGGHQEVGVPFSVDNGTTHIDADSTSSLYALLGIRLKSTHLDASVLLEGIDTLIRTNDDAYMVLLQDPTVAGTFTYSGLTDSCVEYATGATANTVTGGHPVTSGYIRRNAERSVALSPRGGLLGAAIDGTPRELVLCAQPFSANLDILASITFRELS